MMKLSEYKKGTETKYGIITEIYCYDKDYVIFESDNDGGLSYELKDSIDSNCLNLINPLLIKTNNLLKSVKDKKKYANMRAYAMADCFSGNPETGKQVLENLLLSIIKNRTLKSRIAYMLSAIIMVIINIITASLANTIFKEYLNDYIVLVYTIATFGSIGGLISILTKVANLDIDIEGTFFFHIIDGFSRIFLSMISSVIIFIFIKSDILLGIFNNVENPNIFYAFSIISGFSEKFIPDIIKSIEKNQITKSDKKT